MDSDARITDLLLLWKELRDKGQTLTPAELCRACPEHLDEVKRRLAALASNDRKLDHGSTDENKPAHSPAADLNLLFGVLAVQMDLISKDALVAAMSAWMLAKDKPLGLILVEQGALDKENHELLSALVQAHLKKHGHNWQKNLAPLDPTSRKLAAGADDAEAKLPTDQWATRSAQSQESSTTERFQILRPHAEGGLGRVSVARDAELSREVALKEIKERFADDPDSRTRFLREAEITGGLEHPGIVPVYALGTYADGRPFYAMRFIKGDSLKDAIQRFHHPTPRPRGESSRPADFHSLDFRNLLGRFVGICNAIAYAHSRGVLHRDLKPANIMLGKYGETLVVDWGLAKVMSAAANRAAPATPLPAGADESLLKPGSGSGSSETLPGSALGTPAYMSPEQAAGKLDHLGPASDVYSLGATLYHLLAGTVPFEGNAGEVLKKVQAGDFPPPRQVQPPVPAALEAVCLKAMATRPADRYSSARDLADEIERWLADEPVQAWPEPWTVKARRWTNRHRVVVSSAAACLVVAVAALVVGNLFLSEANETIRHREAETHQANQALEYANEKANIANKNLVTANAEATIANKNLLQANEETKTAYNKLAKSEKEARTSAIAEKNARDQAEDLLASSRMMLARSRFEEGNVGIAEDLLEQVPKKYRLAPWGLLKNHIGGSLATLYGHTWGVNSVAFSPDGQLLASGSHDLTIKLWDARTGQIIRTLRGHKVMVSSVAFAPDGQVLASASHDKSVRLWEVRTGVEIRNLQGHTSGVMTVAYSPDGKALASGSLDKTIKLWDARTGQELRTLRGHSHQVISLAFSPDGQVLASASVDSSVKLWEIRTGRELRTLRGHFRPVRSLAFSPDGKVLASASADSTVKLWEIRTGQELRTLPGYGEVMSVAISGDGQTLAAASENYMVALHDLRTGRELRKLRGHGAAVLGMGFSDDGQVLATASFDGTVKLWNARTNEELRTVGRHADFVNSLAFTSDGRMLASASFDQTIKLWDTRTGQEIRALRGHDNFIQKVVFSPDGKFLASASNDKTVKLWETRTGNEVRTLLGHSRMVTNVAFSSDGQTLASASRDKTIKLWNAATGQEIRALHGHSQSVYSVAFSPTSQVLASGSEDRTVKLWNTSTGRETHTLRGHTQIIRSLAFSPDGQVLASASMDSTVKLWRAATGQELRTLRGHSGQVDSLTFAADGQVVASASGDGTVKLWDVRMGQEIRSFGESGFRIASVAYSANDQVLAFASPDNTIKLWDFRVGQKIRALRSENAVVRVVLAPDGKTLWSAHDGHIVWDWNLVTGKQVKALPGNPAHTGVQIPGAWSPDGSILAYGKLNGLILLIPKEIPEQEWRFRHWVTSPDLHLHRDKAEQAERDKRPLAVAFRLGCYLAGKNHFAAAPREAAILAGWLGSGPPYANLLAGMPIAVKTSFQEPIFPDGMACTGVLYKESGIAPERLLIGTARALAGDSANWLNHAFHGGALFRKGEHAKAIEALNRAVQLNGKPSPLTHNLLALTHLELGQKDKAREYLKQALPDQPSWEDACLHRLFQPEVQAALAKAEGKQQGPKKK